MIRRPPRSTLSSSSAASDVYKRQDTILASGGLLDGQPPVVPAGVLGGARATGRNVVTWRPRPGVRVATVSITWSGGTVLAGRSLRLVEDRAAMLELLVGAGWLATLAARSSTSRS